mmetsp:Transcript_39268/g.76210  ORF Transcript_39268/g.76210 Transcript_39268/m.76210 type:complete len:618 (-) Transcript_39268:117-1970(-)
MGHRWIRVQVFDGFMKLRNTASADLPCSSCDSTRCQTNLSLLTGLVLIIITTGSVLVLKQTSVLLLSDVSTVSFLSGVVFWKNASTGTATPASIPNLKKKNSIAIGISTSRASSAQKDTEVNHEAMTNKTHVDVREKRYNLFNVSEQRSIERRTTINPFKTHGVWEGWGVSLAWWGNVYGQEDDLADLAFTLGNVAVNLTGKMEMLPGLGLNIVRYNAGGSSKKRVGSKRMAESPRMPSWKQMEGYWLNWRDKDPNSSSWDWDRDLNQRTMLIKAKMRGADVFELFSNSPMWWMLQNYNPSGAESGGNNIRNRNKREHGYYLAQIAKKAQRSWGIDFRSVEPFNEPSANWWRANGKQEGCHFDPSLQAKVIVRLREELDKLGLQNVSVSASDESYYEEVIQTWNEWPTSVKAIVDRVNVHGYSYKRGPRHLVYNQIKIKHRKQLWQSEYGDKHGDGIPMARNLHLDMKWMHPTAFVHWQVVGNNGGWGLLKGDLARGHLQRVNTKYFVFAQYTRHIRPGMVIVESGNMRHTIAAYDIARQTLVLVTLNKGKPKRYTYDLSHFNGGISGPIMYWVTSTKSSERYERKRNVSINRKQKFSVYSPRDAVMTFEILGALIS